jgi:enterochelin esterase-like enzyme
VRDERCACATVATTAASASAMTKTLQRAPKLMRDLGDHRSVCSVTLHRPNAVVAVVGAALAVFLVIGLMGVRRYVANYLLYRGFAPPQEPAFVTQTGTLEKVAVRSAALDGRRQQTYVYLPPGYATHPHERYPVLYLLHGFPGRPLAFIQTLRMGIVEDSLVARRRAQPLILVMPFGSTGTFSDKEWANGWDTFVARDVVSYVDAHYRTVASPTARAIGGLSEGGYGAINIALHHPHEFSVVESWSGYVKPDPIRSIFGPKLQLLSANDPRLLLPRTAPVLRDAHDYFWLYSGTEDRFRKQNRAFARELTQLHIHNHFFESFGGHNWALWRKNAVAAYEVAARRIRA